MRFASFKAAVVRQRRLIGLALPHLISVAVSLAVGWLWWGQPRTVVVPMQDPEILECREHDGSRDRGLDQR